MQRYDIRGLLLDSLALRRLARRTEGRELLWYGAVGIGVALALGVGLGILLAPRTGGETREILSRRVRQLTRRSPFNSERARNAPADQDLDRAFESELRSPHGN